MMSESAPAPADFTDRVVVVTGAARGMGRVYVNAFLERGARVVAADLRWEPGDAFDAALVKSGRVLPLTMDVTKGEQIDAAFDATMKAFGKVDVLFNNAAMRQADLFPPTGRTTTLETKDDDWERLFGVNVFGVLKVTRRFIKPMIAQRRGSIISIVSHGLLTHSSGGAYQGHRPGGREMPYIASKAALATMSFYLADEVKEHNVAVNLMIPGYVRTTGADGLIRARLARGAKPGPQPLRLEHIVPLALHLAAADASTITGKLFDIVVWNEEHGLGGRKAWEDTSFSYDSLREPAGTPAAS